VTPRDADPLDVTPEEPRRKELRITPGWLLRTNITIGDKVVTPRSLASQTHGYRPGSRHVHHAALLAVGAALVLAGIAVGRATATPRSAPADSGPWTLLEAPHGASPFAPPPTIGTRPASVGASPDLSTPPATSDIGTAIASGTATWYDDGPGLYAAVPTYRFRDPHYRVRVCNRSDVCVVVTVRDFCGCPGDRIIDLSPSAFRKLAPLSRGVIPVSVEDLRGAETTLPPTDLP
jgi:hypothetical protein